MTKAMTQWYFLAMKNLSEFILISTMSLTLLACGAQGGRDLGGGGRYCPADQYKELFKVPKKAEVVTENAGELGTLDLGDYDMTSAEFIHVKKVEPNNNRRWTMFQVNENVDAAGNTRTSRYCARGVQTQDESFLSEAPGIEKMSVGEGDKIDFSPRLWGFQYNSEKLLLEQPYCNDGSSSCEISEKTSFASKLEPGDYDDASEVLEDFGDEVKVVKLYKGKKENAIQRYLILGRSVFVDDDGVENIRVLRVTYYFTSQEDLEQAEQDESGDDGSDSSPAPNSASGPQ
ncbi:MAG: hypothetical protein HRT45_13175 [Bdellovibrionales bacterium]|nr:hypothetical protein [Bdellovibrionales bacterium]